MGNSILKFENGYISTNGDLRYGLRRMRSLLQPQTQFSRFGGLSLGESWAMVNGVRLYRDNDGAVQWLTRDNRGLIGLPVWIDRKTTRGTFLRFSLQPQFDDNCWVTIHPSVKVKKNRTASTRRQKT